MFNKSNKSKYTQEQKKAFYMGYGVGLTGGDPAVLIDIRQGEGQRVDLCSSAQKGYHAGLKNRSSVPFAKGYKFYPVSKKVWFKK